MTQDRSNEDNSLVILWTSQDPEVAKNMVFMYAKNSRLKGWWKEVRLIVWGPSAKLIAMDGELQAELQALIDAGVELLACKACSDRYGVSEKLTDLGINVTYMGQPLTGYLKSGLHLISI